MKKKNLLLIPMLLLPLTNFAQEGSLIRLGIKAGSSLSKMTQDIGNGTADHPFYKFGYFGGGLMEVLMRPGSKFKLQLEILYNQYNFKNFFDDPRVIKNIIKMHVSQLSIPLMAKYFVFPAVSINLGMSANFNLDAKGITELIDFDPSFGSSRFNAKELDGYHSFQLGASTGVSYYFYKGFFVNGQYNYYLSKLVNDPRDGGFDYKNMSAFQLGIGYKF